VLVSSHLLAELALSADQVVIVKGGRLVTQGSVAEITRGRRAGVRVTTPQVHQLRDALEARGIGAEPTGDQELLVRDAGPQVVGRAVAEAGLVVYELAVVDRDLEAAFLELTEAEERAS
jgi:ABC-2 type transport system ATP-binding protein